MSPKDGLYLFSCENLDSDFTVMERSLTGTMMDYTISNKEKGPVIKRH